VENNTAPDEADRTPPAENNYSPAENNHSPAEDDLNTGGEAAYHAISMVPNCAIVAW
jgi:hypothetical protein